MARPQRIDDEALLAKLSGVFRDVGYDGASLALLSEAAGLQRASLYHRFPRGKEQMAGEVLAFAGRELDELVLGPLMADGPLAERVARLRAGLIRFYAGGLRSCLLNLLSSPLSHQRPFAPFIKRSFEAIIDAFAKAARDGGLGAEAARAKAIRLTALLQGSLVLSRGLQSAEPFVAFLDGLDSMIERREPS